MNKDSLLVMFNASRVKLEFDESVIKGEDSEKGIENLGNEVLRILVKAT